MKFKIYQCKDPRNCNYMFLSFKWAEKEGFSLNDYEEVYSGDTYEYSDDTRTLDEIFYVFNMKRPADFRGHSLSTSDIIEYKGVYYYVDSFGFVNLNEKGYSF